jgi:hypothetical protein
LKVNAGARVGTKTKASSGSTLASDIILPEVVQWLEQNSENDGIGNEIGCLWSIVVEA